MECTRWWFQIFFFSPLLGEDDPNFDEHISDGLVQPPTRRVSLTVLFFNFSSQGQLTEVKTSRKHQTESRKCPNLFLGHVVFTVPKCMVSSQTSGPLGPYKVGFKKMY